MAAKYWHALDRRSWVFAADSGERTSKEQHFPLNIWGGHLARASIGRCLQPEVPEPNSLTAKIVATDRTSPPQARLQPSSFINRSNLPRRPTHTAILAGKC